eukprot:3046544-Alexandrium_andersonii.AAC.1
MPQPRAHGRAQPPHATAGALALSKSLTLKVGTTWPTGPRTDSGKPPQRAHAPAWPRPPPEQRRPWP